MREPTTDHGQLITDKDVRGPRDAMREPTTDHGQLTTDKGQLTTDKGQLTTDKGTLGAGLSGNCRAW